MDRVMTRRLTVVMAIGCGVSAGNIYYAQPLLNAIAGDLKVGYAQAGLIVTLSQVGYVLAVACSHPVSTAAGKYRADEIAARLPKQAWQRLSAGAGSKGPRRYDWAWITLDADTNTDTNRGGHRWLLIRRNTSTGELAYYRCHAPHPVPLATLVRVAGRRWTVEESFQASKGLTGLDQHQVRRWTSWHRWTLLAMLALEWWIGHQRPWLGRPA